MTTTNDDDDLGIPEFLRIPQETRRAAWTRVGSKAAGVHTTPRASAGDVCRRAGIPDGINWTFVAALEALATRTALARREEDEKRFVVMRAQEAELKAVRASARAVNGKRKPRRK